MSLILERAAGFFPAAVALALPVVFIPILGDLYILPRASIVIAGACLGLGLAFLTPSTNRLGAWRWPLLAAAVAALLAFVFSVSWPLSLAGSYTRYESLPMRLSYLGLAASAAWLLRSRLQRTVLAAAFVTGCSVAAIQALLMALSNVPFRPDGNVGNANLLAALLVMAVPVAIDGAARAEDWWLSAWVAAIVVMGGGLLVTTSRSGYIGLLAGLAVWATLSVPRRATPLVGAVSLGVVGMVMALFYFSPLRVLNSDPPELRLHLWADSLRLIAARPITGWGEDTTGLTFGHYLSQDYATLVTFDRVHSGPLDVAATQGVLGLAATGAVVAMALWFAWTNRSRAHVAGFAAALAGYSVWVFANFDWSPATGAFWLLLGALWSTNSPLPLGEQSEGEAPATAPSVTGLARRVGVRGGVALRGALALTLALTAIPLAVLPILADAWYLKGRADLAVRVDPLQAQYHWAIGTLPELRAAASLGETDPSMYVQLGDAELQAGNRAQAISAYRRALEIDPYYSPASQRLVSVGG